MSHPPPPLRSPIRLAGPRGSRLIVDRVGGVPLAWFQVVIAGGSAGDGDGMDGFANHVAHLARRGAGERDRRAFDEELDFLGASLQMSADHDSIRLTGLCLRRNLDRVIDLAADVLARPRMEKSEHDKLLRETRLWLDELRDEDYQLMARYFNCHCVPGHPYGRTVAGTEQTLGRIALADCAAAYRRSTVPGNLIIGFAGDIGTGEARKLASELAARLVADLPDDQPPPLPSVASPPMPRGRRLIIVDKPERTQTQIQVGHLGPRFGTEVSLPFIVAETAFGGMFTSRLMQEIRVARGWSYGANCTLERSRGAHWFHINLAPSVDTTPEALKLVLHMLEELASDGITEAEFALARNYLLGSLPFRLATARQRVRLAIQSHLFGLAEDYAESLPERLADVTRQDVNAACQKCLQPDNALSVVVATAATTMAKLADLGAGEPIALPFDSI